MRIAKLGLPALLILCLLSTLSYAAVDRIAGTIDSNQLVTLKGNVHHRALPKYDEGPVDPALKLTYVTLLTTPTTAQLTALEELVAQQQDPKSPNYHKWLTSEEWADRFGLSTADVKKITDWLKSQGLTVASVAQGLNWIVFSGTARQMQSVFGAEIHHFNVDGEMHFANASAPRIPAALKGIVAGFRGLDDFRAKPMNVRSMKANYFDNLFQRPNFIAPGDIATIYDINALYSAGIDGTGQKLAIAGQTDVYLADLNNFRGGFGLSQISGCTTNGTGVITACNTTNFKYILNGPDPGVSLGDLTEADLDLEWSGAVARNAQIIYVNSGGTANGVWDAWYYAVDNNVAPVISLSYGNCEFFNNNVLNPANGAAGPDELELMKANSKGITFFNSSGDSGSAACDPGTNTATNNLAANGVAVSYPASSPEVTGVGGTAITYPGGFSSTFWGTTNGTDGGTAQNAPLPEIAWNDDEELTLLQSGTTALSWQQSYAIVSTGGGASNCAKQTTNFASCVSGFPQPSWQAVTVPSQSPIRFVPDVSLLGSPNFPGYIFCTAVDAWIGGTNSASSCAPGGTAGITNTLALKDTSNNPAPTVVGGTSASTPVLAGIMTLINQKMSTPNGQGNINPILYALAATPANGVFHQVTTGNNIVYCQGGTPTGLPLALQCPGAAGTTGTVGFNASNADATTGYNLVTGLGSVDATKLADAWPGSLPATTTTLVAAPTSINQGQSVTLTATVTSTASATGNVNFFVGGTTALGTSALNGSGVAVLTTTALPAGTDSVTATYAGDSANAGSTSTAAMVTVTGPDFAIATNPTSSTVVAGHATTTITVTVTPNSLGFSSQITFSCSGQPTGASCAFNPATVTPGSAAATTALTISTVASTANGAANVTVTGTGGSATHAATVALTVNPTDQSFSLAPTAASYPVSAGQSVTATVNLTATNGFNSPVTYTCTRPRVGVHVHRAGGSNHANLAQLRDLDHCSDRQAGSPIRPRHEDLLRGNAARTARHPLHRRIAQAFPTQHAHAGINRGPGILDDVARIVRGQQQLHEESGHSQRPL